MARLGPEMAQIMYEIVKLSLIMRYLPKKARWGTRLPTPKPSGDPADTRPLAILHDLYCFLSAVVGKRMYKALEKANLFLPETLAFRQGMGTDDITIVIKATKEDAVESGELLGQVNEDEEKFFDRVLAELQGLSVPLCAIDWMPQPRIPGI